MNPRQVNPHERDSHPITGSAHREAADPNDPSHSDLYAARVAAMPRFGINEIDALAASRGPGLISFAGGAPHLRDLPLSDIASVTAELLAGEDATVMGYGAAQGEPSLLYELERYLSARGLRAPEERLLVTSGALEALDVIFRVFLDPGDLVVVEEPTYSDVICTLSGYRAEVAALPMDSDGAVVADLEGLLARYQRPPKLIYVIPNFHNPTGLTLSFTRRRALLEFAAEHGSIVVEDDAYGLFRFTGTDVPSLAALDDRVIHVHSLSKVVAPGLRVGCILAPANVVEELQLAKQAIDICTPILSQRIVAGFLQRRLVGPHTARLGRLLCERKESLDESLERHFGGTVTWTEPQGGMFTWVEFSEGTDVATLLGQSLDEGVAFVPGPVFSTQAGCRHALRLCFSRLEASQIDEGIRRLRRAYDRGLSA